MPFPPPGALPGPGIEPMSTALAVIFFTTQSPGEQSNMAPSEILIPYIIFDRLRKIAFNLFKTLSLPA